jgi:transposase
MNKKYVGMDVHQSSLVIEVMDERGVCQMQTIIPARTDAVREFFGSLRGEVHVVFEEGTMADWLYELIRPLVAEVVVCNPRRNKLLKVGNHGDKVDAHNLAELLRLGSIKPVYHERQGMQVLKELVHNYDALTRDRTRVMNRIKALYRGRGIPAAGADVYYKRNREQWLQKLIEAGRRQRAEFFYQQLDHLADLCRQARRAMLTEARGHDAQRVLRQISVLGPVRTAQIMAAVVTPHRFRTKRQFWPYVGLGVVTRTTSEYEFAEGRVQRRKKVVATRGLNDNYSHRLKYVFKSAAIDGMRREPFQGYYATLLDKGMRPEMARLTLARKIAAVTLAIWKTGQRFDAARLTATVG